MSRTRPWALAPCILMLAACTSTPEDPSIDPTPSATETEPTSTSSPAEVTASAVPTASAGPTALEVNWTVPFTITAPSDWTTEVPENIGASDGETQWLATGDRHMAFTRSGPESVDQWLDSVMRAEQLVASEPTEVDIGGETAYRVDLEVSDQASSARCFNDGRCYTLFQDASGFWPIEEGRPTALWLVDVDGETVAIATDSRENTFTDWVAEVEEVFGTLEWGD